jgi:hypothetical protein
MSDHIIAKERVYDTRQASSVVLFHPGDKIPIEVAKKLGLVDTKPAAKKVAETEVEDKAVATGDVENKAVKPATKRK